MRYLNHAVSRAQQSRQRKLSVKTLRSPLYAEFWEQCLLSGEALYQSEEILEYIIYIEKIQVHHSLRDSSVSFGNLRAELLEIW